MFENREFLHRNFISIFDPIFHARLFFYRISVLFCRAMHFMGGNLQCALHKQDYDFLVTNDGLEEFLLFMVIEV